MRKNKRGISIAEILACFLIFGILAVVAVPLFQQVIEQHQVDIQNEKVVYRSCYDGETIDGDDYFNYKELTTFVEDGQVIILVDNKGQYIAKLKEEISVVKRKRINDFDLATKKIQDLENQIRDINDKARW